MPQSSIQHSLSGPPITAFSFRHIRSRESSPKPKKPIDLTRGRIILSGSFPPKKGSKHESIENLRPFPDPGRCAPALREAASKANLPSSRMHCDPDGRLASHDGPMITCGRRGKKEKKKKKNAHIIPNPTDRRLRFLSVVAEFPNRNANI